MVQSGGATEPHVQGVGARREEAVVGAKMSQLDLWPFADKTAGSLSGGNKRKLSVAVATIGSPSVRLAGAGDGQSYKLESL